MKVAITDKNFCLAARFQPSRFPRSSISTSQDLPFGRAHSIYSWSNYFLTKLTVQQHSLLFKLNVDLLPSFCVDTISCRLDPKLCARRFHFRCTIKLARLSLQGLDVHPGSYPITHEQIFMQLKDHCQHHAYVRCRG